MKTLRHHRSKAVLFALSTLACVILLVAIPAFADEPSSVPPAVIGIAFFLIAVIGICTYVYTALALQTIARKTNTENAWLAWIPVANILLMVTIAGKPAWWTILLLIPLVNIVFGIIVWMAIAEARNKPNWWGIMLIVPVIGIIVPGYLAWSD